MIFDGRFLLIRRLLLICVTTTLSWEPVQPNTSSNIGAIESFLMRPKRAGMIKLDRDLDVEKRLTRAEISGVIFDQKNSLYLFVAKNGWVGAYEPVKAKLLWWYEVPVDIVSPAFAHDGSLLLSTQQGAMLRIDALTGKKIWETSLDSFVVRNPVVHEKSVFAVTASQQIYNLDWQTGNKLWVYDAGFPNGLTVQTGAPPVVFQENVILGLVSGELESINLASGKAQWRYNPEYVDSRFHDVTGEILQFGNRIVVARYDGLVSCIEVDARDRRVVWKDTITSVATSASRSGWYFVGTVTGDVFAYEAATGKRVWKAALGQGISSITPTEDRVMVSTTTGKVSSLEFRTGNIFWNDDLGASLLARPMIANGVIGFLTGLRNLYFYGL